MDAGELISGTLKIRAIHGKNLWPDEGTTSDPYLKIVFWNKKTQRTKTKKKDLNPVWLKDITMPVEMKKGQYKPLRCEIYDDDLIRDDFIAYCDVPWISCIGNPNKWMIDEIFKLRGSANTEKKNPDKSFGELYL